MFWHRCIQYIRVVTRAYLIISNVILSLWCLFSISVINILYICILPHHENIESSNFDIIHSLKLKGIVTCKVIDPFFNYEGCRVC